MSSNASGWYAGERGGFDAGIGTRRVQQLAIEHAPARLVVAVLLDVQLDRRHVARVEAGIRAPRRVEAARHQSGADQQQQRDRHLRDDETRAQPSARRAARRRVFVDDRHQIDPRALQRRDESEDERAPAGDQRREPDDEAVDLDVEEDALRRGEPLGVADEQRDAVPARAGRRGRRRARRARDSRQPAAGRSASRVAPSARRTRDFAASRHAAHQHEPGDVRARDHQHQQAHRAQHDQRRQHVASGAPPGDLPERHDLQPLRRHP